MWQQYSPFHFSLFLLQFLLPIWIAQVKLVFLFSAFDSGGLGSLLEKVLLVHLFFCPDYQLFSLWPPNNRQVEGTVKCLWFCQWQKKLIGPTLMGNLWLFYSKNYLIQILDGNLQCWFVKSMGLQLLCIGTKHVTKEIPKSPQLKNNNKKTKFNIRYFLLFKFVCFLFIIFWMFA